MTVTVESTDIKASPDKVFETVADMDEYARAIPGIVTVGLAGGKRKGIGTKFAQTREFNGRPSTTELEVTEYQRPSLVRMVADQGGAIWDTSFAVMRTADGSRLTITMEGRPYKFLARILVPLTKRNAAKHVRADLAAIRTYCES